MSTVRRHFLLILLSRRLGNCWHRFCGSLSIREFVFLNFCHKNTLQTRHRNINDKRTSGQKSRKSNSPVCVAESQPTPLHHEFARQTPTPSRLWLAVTVMPSRCHNQPHDLRTIQSIAGNIRQVASDLSAQVVSSRETGWVANKISNPVEAGREGRSAVGGERRSKEGGRVD